MYSFYAEKRKVKIYDFQQFVESNLIEKLQVACDGIWSVDDAANDIKKMLAWCQEKEIPEIVYEPYVGLLVQKLAKAKAYETLDALPKSLWDKHPEAVKCMREYAKDKELACTTFKKAYSAYNRAKEFALDEQVGDIHVVWKNETLYYEKDGRKHRVFYFTD